MFIRHHACILALLLPSLAAASSTVGYAGALDTTLKVSNTGAGKSIVGTSGGSGTIAVTGRSTGTGGTGVQGIGDAMGVRGESSDVGVSGEGYNSGVAGYSYGGTGVLGLSDTYVGVSAQGYSYGVMATASPYSGQGVWASGLTGAYGYSDAAYGTGVMGGANAEEGVNTGVSAYAYGGSTAYGVYATASSASQNWAGYFAGNVHVTGTLTYPSDARFKKNVRPLPDGLGKVMALKPKAYEMNVEEFKGRVRLSGGGQYGLIAQEVEAVLPELVQAVTAPSEPEAGKSGARRAVLEYKSVNYLALIPILVEAVQEQQALIRAQQARIEALERGR